jgi:TP901 family phage tail tape measure protein
VPVLDLAAAGNVSVAEAADVSMAVLNAYGKSVDEITSVNDRLMRGTQLSALRTNEFITIMGRAAATGNLFGNALDDVIIGLGSMRSAGIPATVATTSMSEAMRRVYTDTEAQKVLMDQFGISVQDSAGNLRSILDVASELSVGMRDMTEAERASTVMQIFHVRGMQQFNALANIQARVTRNGTVETLRGAEAIAYYRQELDSAAGTTQEFRERRLATFQGALVLLQGTMQTLGTVIGQTFGDIFRPMVTAVTNTINAFIRAWVSLPENLRKFIGIATLVAAGFSVIAGGAGVVIGGLVLVIGLFGELALIAAAVGAGIAAAMIPAMAAIGALVAAGYGLYRAWQENLGGLGAFVETWVGRVRRTWAGLEMIFTQGYLGGGALRDLLANNETQMVSWLRTIEQVVDNAKAVWRGFRHEFAQVWQEMDQPIAEFREALDGLFGQLISSHTTMTSRLGEIPSDQYEGFGRTLAQGVGEGFRLMVQAATSAVQVLTQIVGIIESPAWQTFTTVAIKIAEVLQWIMDTWASIRGFVGGTEGAMSALFRAATTPIFGAAPGAAASVVSGLDVAQLGGLLRPVSQIYEEAGVEPPSPAGATQRGGGVSSAEMQSMLERSLERRPITMRNNIQVNVGGRTVAEVEESERVSQSVYGGGLYEGPQSVWVTE